jgi:hypothetical protein
MAKVVCDIRNLVVALTVPLCVCNKYLLTTQYGDIVDSYKAYKHLTALAARQESSNPIVDCIEVKAPTVTDDKMQIVSSYNCALH